MIDRVRNRMHVAPSPGIKIRKSHELAIAMKNGRPPDFLKAAGEWVPRTVEWRRALDCADVVLVDPPVEPAVKSAKKGK